LVQEALRLSLARSSQEDHKSRAGTRRGRVVARRSVGPCTNGGSCSSFKERYNPTRPSARERLLVHTWYDDAGNRNTGGSTVGTNNQITTDGAWNYGYNKEGDLTAQHSTGSNASVLYYYDGANELTEVQQYDSGGTLTKVVNYDYDAFGELIERQENAGYTKYAVDGWNPNMPAGVGNANFNHWAVLNSNGTLQTRNLFDNRVDELLARVDQSGASDPAGTYWLLEDRLNSVREVIDNSGAVKDSAAYDAFGNVSESAPSYRGWYAWTGRQLDAATGLQYNNARWYNPAMGRWVSQDPLGFDAGDSNLYRYATNNYAANLDPAGLQTPPAQNALDKTAGIAIGFQQEETVREVTLQEKVLVYLVHYGVLGYNKSDIETAVSRTRLATLRGLENAPDRDLERKLKSLAIVKGAFDGKAEAITLPSQHTMQLTGSWIVFNKLSIPKTFNGAKVDPEAAALFTHEFTHCLQQEKTGGIGFEFFYLAEFAWNRKKLGLSESDSYRYISYEIEAYAIEKAVHKVLLRDVAQKKLESVTKVILDEYSKGKDNADLAKVKNALYEGDGKWLTDAFREEYMVQRGNILHDFADAVRDAKLKNK
jgi:RHS repeat-associated protein